MQKRSRRLAGIFFIMPSWDIRNTARQANLRKRCCRLGIQPQEGLAITGVKGELPGTRDQKVRVAVMGELDALPISNASHTNPETGAAHCCGHHAQLTGVLGAAIALSDPEVKANLDGVPVFMAVPAEECVDLEFKEKLAQEGKIRYFGGKCEFIRIGAMDDIRLGSGAPFQYRRF